MASQVPVVLTSRAAKPRFGYTTLRLSVGEACRFPANRLSTTQHLFIKFNKANPAAYYACQKQLATELARQDVSGLIAVTVEGSVATYAQLELLDVVLRHLTHVRMLDLSLAYPCGEALVALATQLPQLHELHLSLLYHSTQHAGRALQFLSQQTQCTVEHLELYHCDNKHLTPELLNGVYRLPHLARVAFRDYLGQDTVQLAQGFDKALTWDADAQAWTTRNSWLVRRDPRTERLRYTLLVSRQAPKHHAPAVLAFTGPGRAFHLLTQGNLKHPQPRWGYVNHDQALSEALAAQGFLSHQKAKLL